MLAALGAPCFAGDSAMDRATMRGLVAVKVVIDQPPSEIEREGLDREHLRTIIEQKLREGGLKIDNDAVEFLGLAISYARAGRRNPLSLGLSLGLYQVVTLSRDKTTKTVAETWGEQRVLSVPPRAVDHTVGDTIEELVSHFVTAYRAVNPQQAGASSR